MKNKIIEVFTTYKESLEKGDFKTVFETLSDDIVWHMNGESRLSGVIVGKEELAKRFGEFAEISNGTFRVITNWFASNDCFVVASVVSMAERNGDKLNMNGIDLFKIENGKIQEVWTFAQCQSTEDAFWNKLD